MLLSISTSLSKCIDKIKLLCCLAILFYAPLSYAVIIDFEGLVPEGGVGKIQFINDSFDTKAFRFQLILGHLFDKDFPISTLPVFSSDYLEHETTSPLTFFRKIPLGTTTPKLFNLVQLEYSSFILGRPGTGTVTGFYEDGTSISETLNFDLGVETAVFSSAWSNLTHVTFEGYPYQAYDNITVQLLNDDGTIAVFEPSPALMLSCIGLLTLFVIRRRKVYAVGREQYAY